MPSYWWKCENEKCQNEVIDFKNACGHKNLAEFIFDKLLVDEWDQNLLKLICGKCGQSSLRITYEFPRKEKERIQVVHIVGLGPFGEGKYLPMLWETYPESDRNIRWFDFKYLNGPNIFGLNRPAVFTREQLKDVFQEYKSKTNKILL